MLLHDLARFSVSIHEILASQKQITAHLKNATQLERPGYLTGRRKKPEHLHDITSDPIRDDGNAEALARARLVIRQYLGKRKCGFDGETDGAEARRIEGV